MRNKTIVVRGFADVGRKITIAEFERINADLVVVITALRKPQFIPRDPGEDDVGWLVWIRSHTVQIAEHLRSIDQDHFLTAEYASVMLDHGACDVKVVEGECLRVGWFFEVVRAFHKQSGVVVEAEVLGQRAALRIDQAVYPMPEAVERLRPFQTLG